ncbi:hypothetical protein I3760_14G116700 [Carya illinoinensis]|nr:hypothetical protein I3760_14G116700 [Carya illinoinensis]
MLLSSKTFPAFLLALSVPFSNSSFNAFSATNSLTNFNFSKPPVLSDHNTAATFSRLRGVLCLASSHF